MKKLVAGSALVVAVAAIIAAAALATPAVLVTSTGLAEGNVEDIDAKVKTGAWKIDIDTKGPTTVATSEIKVAPGGNFGWHSHPGVSLVIVKSGTSTFYSGEDPTCTPQVHRAGSAYVDPGGMTHIARNEGAVELVLLVTRLMPAGATPRIDQPAPGNCPF